MKYRRGSVWRVLQAEGVFGEKIAVGSKWNILINNTVFLAALEALGLPWLINQSLFHWLLWIQSLPAFQSKPEPRKTDGGHEETWPDQQKDNDKDKDKDKCKDKDKYNDI